MRKNQAGGTVIGKSKLYTLAYADDMAMIAHSVEELKDMIKALERYLSRKDLILNVEKTKVMTFSNGGRLSKSEWKWENRTIDEVKAFKYLGFTFQSNGKHSKHIENISKEAKRRTKEVWGIGERKFADNFRIRIDMFDSLIKSSMFYASEIYGWRQYEEI